MMNGTHTMLHVSTLEDHVSDCDIGDVCEILESAIEFGVLDGITLDDFYDQLDTCQTVGDREDFLQRLWDRI